MKLDRGATAGTLSRHVPLYRRNFPPVSPRSETIISERRKRRIMTKDACTQERGCPTKLRVPLASRVTPDGKFLY